MTQVLDPDQAPQWFLDLFLEAYSEAKNNYDRLKASRSFIGRTQEGDNNLTGIGFLTDNNEFIFLGRKFFVNREGEEVIEHYKYKTRLNQDETNQENGED